MPSLPKPKKKTKEKKVEEKIKKRRKLEKKWRKKALEKKSKKRKKKKQTKTKTWYRDKLDIVFSQYIRLRDQRCQKCGKETVLHCSHVIPKSQSYYLRWDELNAKALCAGCHLYWWHKDILAAKEWFDEKFPDRAKYLATKRNIASNFTLEDYQDMYKHYKEKVKEYE